MRSRRRRRKLDVDATLDIYERRIRNLDQVHFDDLDGSYLATFDVYGTIDADDDGTVTPAPGMTPCTAFVIARVAAERGVRIRGITSERTSRGRFICATMPDGTPREHVPVRYVGPYNYFTQHRGSIWSLMASDKVYDDTAPSL